MVFDSHEAITLTRAGILIGPTWIHGEWVRSYYDINFEWRKHGKMPSITSNRVAVFNPSLQWHHNGRDSVSNHQPYDCLLNRFFRHRSMKTSKLRVTGLCAGNSPVTGEFPAQISSNAENVLIWWRHHVTYESRRPLSQPTAVANMLTFPLQWRHNDRDGVSNHQPRDCLLNRLFKAQIKETSRLRVTGLCAGNSPVTGEFPAQKGQLRGKCFHLMTSSCAHDPSVKNGVYTDTNPLLTR